MNAMHGYAGEPAHLGRVLILGLGKSGMAAASYCLGLLGSRVDAVVVAAGTHGESADRNARVLEERGAQVVFDRSEFECDYDLCIASPGISEFSDFYLNAKSASREIVSEVEFAWRESPAGSRWVAVTGTNGKTTTTSLIAHILREAGESAVACGNIGDTCIGEVEKGEADVYVAEVSSYQLASTVDFAPNVAVLLNITPDHVKWHRGHENYKAAKFKVFANLHRVPGSLCVLDATNADVRERVRELRALGDEERGFAYMPVGCARGLSASMRDACGSVNAAWLDEGVLSVRFGDDVMRLVDADELSIKGEHNASNALAAASAAIGLGVDAARVAAALRTFAPLEHRIEPCGTVRGVQCFNDSKATNVDATLKALAAFGRKRPIVLLGGDDKGTDLAELVAAAEAHCKAVVCFGAAGQRFFDAFDESSCPRKKAGCLEDALDVALADAVAGDIVILSPACASFDEFSCFEERGEAFKSLVAARSVRAGS